MTKNDASLLGGSYAIHGASLMRELFVASGQFLAQRLLRAASPMLCNVQLPDHGYPSAVIWVGREDAYLGSGLYMFRDLTHYREWFGVLMGQLEWEPEDDRSVLALTFEHVRWLPGEGQRVIRRAGLPLHPPGFSPVIRATDRHGQPRAHRAIDLQCVALAARAIAQAVATERDGEHSVALCGESHTFDVQRRHPEASEQDVNLCLRSCDQATLAELRAEDERRDAGG